MLRKIRIVVAALLFIGVSLLFFDVTGVLHLWLGWIAKIQFLPAFLALNFVIVAAIALLTLIFGRIYCSVICPLGIMQDIISWFSGRRKGKKKRFGFKKEKKWLRIGFLVVFLVLLAAGINSIAILIAPYSAFGRIATNIFSPVYGGINNLLAYFSERAGSYAFYPTEAYIKSLSTFIVAVVTFILIFIMAWTGGRTWCNTVCPVGTILGFISKFSIFRPSINTDKCINCGKCGKMCKASCINTKEHKIDYSRCVVCMDCLNNCNEGAIEYTYRRKKAEKQVADAPVDKGRRGALAIIGMAASSIALNAQEDVMEGGLAVLEEKKRPAREVSPKPAGSENVKHFNQHCTGCQLCVANCPNRVLSPSTKLENLMQPEMSFEKGFCRPECTRCGEVCPTGAIKKVSKEEKSSIQIGHAVYIPDNCVVNRDGVRCGNCERHCPTGAINMVPRDSENTAGLKIPSVDVERCIGCGACESVCPSRPLSAIYVEGHLVHKEI